MKKTLKWATRVVGTLLSLFVLLSILIYFPPVQNWLVRHVAAYASAQSGMEISVERVRLVFPLNLGIDGVEAVRQNDSLPQIKDTLVAVRKIVANVELIPLFHKQVMVDELRFHQAKVNSSDLIHQARIRGYVGQFYLSAHGIDLGKEKVKVEKCVLSDSKLSVELSDTVPPDTTPSSNLWKIQVERLHVSNTDFALHMPGDTLAVHTYLGQLKARQSYVDFQKGLYQMAALQWRQGRLNFDNNFKVHSKGIDFNHLAFDKFSLLADSLSFCDSKLQANIRQCMFREQSGLTVDSLSGVFSMDSLSIQLPSLSILTPTTRLKARINMNLDAFAEKNPGKLLAEIHGRIGKPDLMLFLQQSVPAEFCKRWPNHALAIDGTLKGNLNHLAIGNLHVALPSAFRLDANGWISQLAQIDRLRANIQLQAQTFHLGFATSMLPRDLMRQLNIPYGIGLRGVFNIDGPRVGSRFILSEGGGTLGGNAAVDIRQMSYKANLSAHNLAISHFLPGQDIRPLTARIDINGHGTDLLSPSTSLQAKASVSRFGLSNYDLSHIVAQAHVRHGRIHANINSNNELLKGLLTFDALTRSDRLQATVAADISKADLYHLHLMREPMIMALCGHLDVASDLKEHHQLQGLVSDITIANLKRTYRPDDIVVDVLTRRDTTHAIVDCGDFHIAFDAGDGYKRLSHLGSGLMKEMRHQLQARIIDQHSLRKQLPNARLYLTSGPDNYLLRMMKKYYGYDFKNANVDLTSSPSTGLNGHVCVDSLLVSNVQLDTVRIRLNSGENGLAFQTQVHNNKDNPQYSFNFLCNGQLYEKGARLQTRIYDANDQLGLRAGVAAEMEQDGIRTNFYGDDPVLGYKTFKYNEDNYVFVGRDKRLSADVLLKSTDGMGIQVYTDDTDSTALQNLTISLNRFDIERLLSVIPYAPAVGGIMDGDFHVVQTPTELTVSSAINVENMSYEHCAMGNIGTEFVYMPLSSGVHQVNGILTQDGRRVATIDGTYDSSGIGKLDAKLGLEHTPLAFINGFIPDQIIGLKGYGEGQLSVKGELSRPDVNGEVFLDSGYVVSMPYGVEMRFGDDPVIIKNSRLLFENFELFAHNDSPMDIAGYFDFSNLEQMKLDVRMRARDFLLIDDKENPRSETYGKAYVNFMGLMRGELSHLQMRGRLEVLGNTDMTYVLRESELSTDNELNELVKFTDFSDTTSYKVDRPTLEGFDMNLSLSVDESAHILCALNADHTNYIDLMGGGDLQLSYNPTEEMRLTGRYTLNNGQMKYALPVIPLKTFNIQDGSYLEFTGDPFDPILNITATENTKSLVNDGNAGRSVDFVCGVKLTKTLSKPGILFIIQAPSDITIQDQLNTMSAEEQSKVAITMLVSGMYLSDGNTKSFSMNSALNSFLNAEINNIAGTAMRSMGLDLGMNVDNSTNAAGETHTDYNFTFAKRLWNNRLSILVGGQVSTGADLEGVRENNTFFDNIELQYRLNQNASQYVRAFYDYSTYDWLEGQIGEYGVGFTWKRKLQHFGDIFRWNTIDKRSLPADSSQSHNRAPASSTLSGTPSGTPTDKSISQ